jgi:hypothetical protein
MNDYPFFHAGTRGGVRERDAHERNNTATYYANNPSSCGNASAWNAASEFVGLVPKGNYGNSPEGGCAIDTHSALLWGDPAALRFKGPKQLFQRPFPTTPFLGMGDPDAVPAENRVKYGYSTANRKSIQTTSDKQWPVFIPLIQEKQEDIYESNHFIEKFLRGGLASRNIPKVRLDLR